MTARVENEHARADECIQPMQKKGELVWKTFLFEKTVKYIQKFCQLYLWFSHPQYSDVRVL
jgi:hypothetical protein